jgi:hypothetical protein
LGACHTHPPFSPFSTFDDVLPGAKDEVVAKRITEQLQVNGKHCEAVLQLSETKVPVQLAPSFVSVHGAIVVF